MTPEQREEIRALLQKRLDEVRAGLVASTDDARPVGLDLAIGRVTRVDALQHQHMAAARKQRLELQLAQIQQALAKLDAGSFGDCVRCDEPIGFARLRVRPESPFCLRCQDRSS